MTRDFTAIYEQGVLRLKERLPVPDGTEVNITVTSRQSTDQRSQAMDDQSWDALTKLLAECEINIAVSDLRIIDNLISWE